MTTGTLLTAAAGTQLDSTGARSPASGPGGPAVGSGFGGPAEPAEAEGGVAAAAARRLPWKTACPSPLAP